MKRSEVTGYLNIMLPPKRTTPTFLLCFFLILGWGFQARGEPAQPQATEESSGESEVPAAPETEAPGDAEPLVPLEGEELELAASVFAANCAMCHGEDGTAAGDLNLVDELWKHGGELAEIEKTIREGAPGTKMTPKADDLTDPQITLVARYVKHLALQMHGMTPEPERKAATELTDQLAARLPPAEQGEVIPSDSIVDHYIFGKMKADEVPYAGLCSDGEFFRRVHLDLWGRLPDAEAVREFLADTDPNKRDALIDKLLWIEPGGWGGPPEDEQEFSKVLKAGDYVGPWQVDDAFVSKWRCFFEDLFRNKYTYAGVHYFSTAEGLREYIKLFLQHNLPYDFFARELLTATALSGKNSGPSGYLIRNAVKRGGEAHHEDTCDEIAVNATQDFLGVNAQCISCHDGANHLEKSNLWLTQRKREEFWRQAAFFGETRIFSASKDSREFVLIDGPTLRQKPNWRGDVGYRMDAASTLRIPRDATAEITPAFLLSAEAPSQGSNLREEFARMVTSDLQFAKVIVNLIWAKLMTVGIVDPPLEWDLARQDPANPPPAPWTIQPSHPELLTVLAKDFQRNNYDLRHLMRIICRSRAYQLSSRFEGEYKPEWDRYYARRLVRRLSAEETYDALAKATNVFGHGAGAKPKVPVRFTTEWTGWAMDLPGPLLENQFCDEALKDFLFFFNRSNRELKWPDSKSSIVQTSLLLYSDLVRRKVLAKTEDSRVGTLLTQDPPLSNFELVEELYLHTLSRQPTAYEMAEAVKHLEEYRDKGLENLQWALVNKLEFIVNY